MNAYLHVEDLLASARGRLRRKADEARTYGTALSAEQLEVAVRHVDRAIAAYDRAVA